MKTNGKGEPTAAGVDEVRRQWGSTVDGGAEESASIKSSAFSRTDGDGAVAESPEAVAPRRTVAAKTGAADRGDFVLGELLGKGGMGLVFRAEQAGLDRAVALKTIITDHAADRNARAKFVSEAKATGQLDHPNIVPIYELAAAPDGVLFYTMKEVRGRSWAKAMPGLGETENIDILLKVADAVAFAHGKGVVHRDLKPENVMLGDYGEVLVMDWGLAVGIGGDAKAERLSPGNARGGTPAYMAPEMASADVAGIGPASDVYLLGAILYEVLTGLRPHHGQNVFACIYSAMRNTIQPTERRDEMVEIAKRALATEPSKRYADVKSFQRAIRDCREHAASLALSNEARATLKLAMESGDYTDYARAVFGFGEALRLWPENNAADTGLSRARKSYAEAALERGDFDLALSQTRKMMSTADARSLGQRAEAGKLERERRKIRVKRLSRLAAGLAVLVLLVGGVAYRRVSQAERRAVAERNEAELSKREAVQSLAAETAAHEKAEAARKDAIQAAQAARREKEKAQAAGEIAQQSRKNEAAARQTAETALREVMESRRIATRFEQEATAAGQQVIQLRTDIAAFVETVSGKEPAAAGERNVAGELAAVAEQLPVGEYRLRARLLETAVQLAGPMEHLRPFGRYFADLSDAARQAGQRDIARRARAFAQAVAIKAGDVGLERELLGLDEKPYRLAASAPQYTDDGIPYARGGRVGDFPEIDRLFHHIIRETKTTAAVIAVDHQFLPDGPAYVCAYGWLDANKKVPAPSDVLMSLPGMFFPTTGALARTLIADGRLRADEPVMAYLSMTPAWKNADPRLERITAQHLLDFKSGLGKTWNPGRSPMDKNGFLKKMKPKGPRGNGDFEFFDEPGATARHSDFDYFLLRLMAEKATGLDYYGAFKKVVMEPLGIVDMYQLRSSPRYPREPWYPAPGAYTVDMGGKLYTDWVASAEAFARFLRFYHPWTGHIRRHGDGSVWKRGAPHFYGSANASTWGAHSMFFGFNLSPQFPPGEDWKGWTAELDGAVKRVYASLRWIGVVSPGENTRLIPGRTLDIQWETQNVEGAADVDLVDMAGNSIRTIGEVELDLDKSLKWVVPDDLPPGAYRVRITLQKERRIYGISVPV